MQTLKPVTNTVDRISNRLIDRTIDEIQELTDIIMTPWYPEVVYTILDKQRAELEAVLWRVIEGNNIH